MLLLCFQTAAYGKRTSILTLMEPLGPQLKPKIKMTALVGIESQPYSWGDNVLKYKTTYCSTDSQGTRLTEKSEQPSEHHERTAPADTKRTIADGRDKHESRAFLQAQREPVLPGPYSRR